MYCSNCGKKIGNNIKYCPHCGSKVGSEKQKPIAAYVVKNPDIGFQKAQKLIKNTLALGILQCVNIVISIIFLVMAFARLTNSAAIGLSVFFGLILYGSAIAQLVLLIMIWVRWRAIKEHTKVSHLWATIGYPVCMGISFIFVTTNLIIALLNGPETAIIVLSIISNLAEVFNIFISFYLYHKIKTTIHR